MADCHLINMGGFSSVFLRVPEGVSPQDFATEAVARLRQSPGVPKLCIRVQFASGYGWLHLDGFGGEASHLKSWFGGEAISLGVQNTASASYYQHLAAGRELRRIVVCEGEIYADIGSPENWERAAGEAWASEYGGSSAEWLHAFDVDMVLKAFHLPSPWVNQEPNTWMIDIEI